MKLISYMITCGGDAGWRFSNGEEWCSIEGFLMFDAEKWDVDKIATAMNQLWHSYWDDRNSHGCWSLSQKLQSGYKHLIPFIDNHDGVYVDLDGPSWGENRVKEDKKIHSKEHEVTRWSKDGKEKNYNYDK